MSVVRHIGDWEVESSKTENKVFFSDVNGKLVAEFNNDIKGQLDMIEWIQANSKRN